MLPNHAFRTLAVLFIVLCATLNVPPLTAQSPLPLPVAASAEGDPAPVIPLTSPDGQIRSRLVTLFREMDGLQHVRVAVSGGIVTLQGTTLDEARRAEAGDVATRVDGVVAVENQIATEYRLDRRLAPLIERTQAIGASILAFLPLLTVALIVFVAFWIAGKLLTRSTSLFRRVAPNPFIEALFEQIVRLLFIVVGLAVAMNILGVSALIGSVLGAAGVIGLAIGFAVRDTIENYIASILLSVRRPFAPNDTVVIEGVEGRVTTLNSRATILITGDGNEVRIPNSIVYKAVIINYTHTPERRFEFDLRVSSDTDISCALSVALNAMKGVEGVLDDPKVAVLVDRVDDFAIALKILGWVDQGKSDFGKVRSEALRSVKEAFDTEQIKLAEPVQNYRKLAPLSEAAPAAKTRQPTRQEMREIQDTSVDRTIDEKVQERREAADNDLLTEGAPRE